MSKLLRTDLPDGDWAALSAMADEAGLTIGVYAKRLLLTHVRARDTGISKVSDDEWAHVLVWMQSTGLRYDGAVKTRPALLTWAISMGYDRASA